jgi:hypothetical protein
VPDSVRSFFAADSSNIGCVPAVQGRVTFCNQHSASAPFAMRIEQGRDLSVTC